MSLNNINNQNIQTGIKSIKDIPYTQNNSIGIDPTPGILCFGAFLLILVVLYKKCEQHYLNYFEHKKQMDILELELKFNKKI